MRQSRVMWAPSVTVFDSGATGGGWPVCMSCGADCDETACIATCDAARWPGATRERRVFLCEACLRVALELLQA